MVISPRDTFAFWHWKVYGYIVTWEKYSIEDLLCADSPFDNDRSSTVFDTCFLFSLCTHVSSPVTKFASCLWLNFGNFLAIAWPFVWLPFLVHLS